MPIGTSDGQVFESEWDHAASQYVDPAGRTRLTVTPAQNTMPEDPNLSDKDMFLHQIPEGERYDDTPTPQQKALDGSVYNSLKLEEQDMEGRLNDRSTTWRDNETATSQDISHYPKATLDLSSIPRNDPKEPIEQGNIDLNARPVVKNPAGGYSTVDSISVGTDKGEVLIPKVAHDGSGILSDEEAKKQYLDTGKHLGIFNTPDDATAYAKQLHLDQEKQYGPQIQHLMQQDQAIEKLTNNFDTYKTFGRVLNRVGTGLANLAAFPGKVMKGDVDIQTPEGREQSAKWAAEMALTMVMIPAPLVTKSVDGTLGSIAGIRAKTADKDLLDVAVAMDKRGYTNNEIWQNSGWFKGSDGNWRHEIPNSDKATFTEPSNFVTKKERNELRYANPSDKEGLLKAIEENPKYQDTTLGKVFDYPELYKAYPDLKNMPVTFKGIEGELGHYSSTNGSININLEAIKKNKTDVVDTLIHEVQHAIQAKEGYVYGTAPNNIGKFIGDEVQKAIKAGDSVRMNELYAIVDKYLGKKSPELEAIKKELYERSPGERESNLVEARRYLTQEQRDKTSPSYFRRLMDNRDNTSEYRSKVFPEDTLSTGNQQSKISTLRVGANDNKALTSLSDADLEKQVREAHLEYSKGLSLTDKAKVEGTKLPQDFKDKSFTNMQRYHDLYQERQRRQEVLDDITMENINREWAAMAKEQKEANKRALKDKLTVISNPDK